MLYEEYIYIDYTELYYLRTILKKSKVNITDFNFINTDLFHTMRENTLNGV